MSARYSQGPPLPESTALRVHNSEVPPLPGSATPGSCIYISKRGALAAEYSARNARKLLLQRKILFAMSLMTKLTLVRRKFRRRRFIHRLNGGLPKRQRLNAVFRYRLNLLRRKIPPQK